MDRDSSELGLVMHSLAEAGMPEQYEFGGDLIYYLEHQLVQMLAKPRDNLITAVKCVLSESSAAQPPSNGSMEKLKQACQGVEQEMK